MDKIKLAIGTDDEIEFSKDHFGSAKKYLIYEINFETKELTHLSTIENETPEEEMHGDPKKAKNIGELLGDVQILVAKLMGKNILRMKKKFLPIICFDLSIQEFLSIVFEYLPEIQDELDKPQGVDKTVLKIRK